MSNQDQRPSPEPPKDSPTGEQRPTETRAQRDMRQTLYVTTSARAAGHVCPKCGHQNRPGILVCEKCGTLMLGEEKSSGTKRFGSEEDSGDDFSPRTKTETGEMLNAAVSTAGSSQFTSNMVLRFEVEGAPTPILLTPKEETAIGRRDPATGTMPDVDLSAYAGYRLGVSRKHAIIRFQNDRLDIYDLGSSNGTTVNGARLTPHEPHTLRDGDEILLGKMSVTVLFQRKRK
jgi:predicted component of type VI protein secretion system